MYEKEEEEKKNKEKENDEKKKILEERKIIQEQIKQVKMGKAKTKSSEPIEMTLRGPAKNIQYVFYVFSEILNI